MKGPIPAILSATFSLVKTGLGLLVSLVLFFLMCVTFADVIARYLFNAPIRGAYEMIQYSLAVVIFGALPLATISAEHVKIDLLARLFTGLGGLVQQFCVYVLAALACGVLAIELWGVGTGFADYNQETAYLRLPLSPLAYFVSVMAGLTFAAHLVLALKTAIDLLQRVTATGP